MFRRAVKLEGDVLPFQGSALDERWNGAASRLLESLLARQPADLDPELERFLRRFIRAKARRWSRQLGERANGVDSEDVAQRVFLQLLEHPPDHEAVGRPMRRLVSWATAVSHNYLHDLTTRSAERLAGKPGEVSGIVEREASGDDGPSESRYAAREALLRVRPALERDYPLGLPLLALLLDSPHATSQELARQLGTSSANIDQMRSRIRRVLRKHLGESRDSNRRSR